MIRPPKPYHPRRSKFKRLLRRKPVTICAAGITGMSIIAVHDSKLSFFGGSISGEGMAYKARDITKNWTVLFAGDISTLTPLLDAVEEVAKDNKSEDLRHFARACAYAYREERENVIEDEVLPDYDLHTYKEYLALKQSDPTLFDAISTKIHDVEGGWNLLFCGFDTKRRPHIFVISNRGKIQYCDTEGFAAISSGGWAASVALVSYPFNKTLKESEAAYCMLAAKFAAESAEGVGTETTLRIIAPGDSWKSFLGDDVMESMKTKWRALPRIPIGAIDELKTDLDKHRELIIKTMKQVRRARKNVKRQESSLHATLGTV